MADIVAGKQIQCSQVIFNTTPAQGSVADLGGVSRVLLTTNADCYVDFDQPIATTQSFKLLASNVQPVEVSPHGGLINQIYVRGVSGPGILYIVAMV